MLLPIPFMAIRARLRCIAERLAGLVVIVVVDGGGEFGSACLQVAGIPDVGFIVPILVAFAGR